MYSGSFMALPYFSMSALYIGHLCLILVLRLELTDVFHVYPSIFEPSLEFVVFMDIFQLFCVRWMTVPS